MSSECDDQLFSVARYVNLQRHVHRERAVEDPPDCDHFWEEVSVQAANRCFGTLLKVMVRCRCPFFQQNGQPRYTPFSPDIDIENSMSYDILNPLFVAPVLSFVLKDRFLRVDMSFPFLAGNWDNAVVTSSVSKIQAQTPVSSFWQHRSYQKHL